MCLRKRFPANACYNPTRRIENFLAPQYEGFHLMGSDHYEGIKDDLRLPYVCRTEALNISPNVSDTEGNQDIRLSPTSKLKINPFLTPSLSILLIWT